MTNVGILPLLDVLMEGRDNSKEAEGNASGQRVVVCYPIHFHCFADGSGDVHFSNPAKSAVSHAPSLYQFCDQMQKKSSNLFKKFDDCL